MDITIYNTDREREGIVDVYESLIWTDRYGEPGDFELVVPISDEMLTLLAHDNYVSIPSSDDWMVIEVLTIKTDETEGDKLVVSGRSLLSLFERRQEPSGLAFGFGGIPPIPYRADLVLERFVDWAFADNSPTVASGAEKEVAYITSERSTDSRILAGDQVTDIPVDYRTAVSTRGMMEKMLSLNILWGVGIKAEVNASREFVFSVYLGQDRTRSQTDNDIVVFSPEFNNLLSSEWTISKRAYKNVMYSVSAAEPPPEHRVYWWDNKPSDTPEGLDRREGYESGRHISAYEPGTTTPKSTSDYEDDLHLFAREELEKVRPYSFFTGQALDVTFVYGTHYSLGDIVQFENQYGLSGIAMVTEVTYSEDLGGTELYPTFEFINE